MEVELSTNRVAQIAYPKPLPAVFDTKGHPSWFRALKNKRKFFVSGVNTRTIFSLACLSGSALHCLPEVSDVLTTFNVLSIFFRSKGTEGRNNVALFDFFFIATVQQSLCLSYISIESLNL